MFRKLVLWCSCSIFIVTLTLQETFYLWLSCKGVRECAFFLWIVWDIFYPSPGCYYYPLQGADMFSWWTDLHNSSQVTAEKVQRNPAKPCYEGKPLRKINCSLGEWHWFKDLKYTRSEPWLFKKIITYSFKKQIKNTYWNINIFCSRLHLKWKRDNYENYFLSCE